MSVLDKEVLEATQHYARQLSAEHKAKMKAGRERAKAEREAKAAKKFAKAAMDAVEPRPLKTVSLEKSDILAGLTSESCPSGCTPERCVITGRRQVRFENQRRALPGERDPQTGKPIQPGDLVVTYETGFVTHCGHPNKNGLQAIHKVMPEVVVKYNRAKLLLEHLAVDKKNV